VPTEVMSQLAAARGLWALLSGPQAPRAAAGLFSYLPLAARVLDPVFLAQQRDALTKQQAKAGQQARAKKAGRVR